MTATKCNFLHDAKMLAEVTWRRHIQRDDYEKCFNLFTFLEDLENELIGFVERTGRFELDPSALARVLWCDMALRSGDAPDGGTFRGMPILD